MPFHLFYFWKELWCIKVKESILFVKTKIQTLIKTKRSRKWKIQQRDLERRTLCFSSYKNCKLKAKCERKKTEFFITFILSEGNSTCVLSQCIVYWIRFQDIYTYTYQKTVLQKLFLLVFKAFNVYFIIFICKVVYDTILSCTSNKFQDRTMWPNFCWWLQWFKKEKMQDLEILLVSAHSSSD